jgi:hypothetical protein
MNFGLSCQCGICHYSSSNLKPKLVGPFWDLRVEVGLTPNFMKGIHIFPLSIVRSFFYFFFYQVSWMCNAWSCSRRNKKKLCLETFLNWCSINIISNAKWVKGISIHIFTKNQNSIKCVMILKVLCVLILCLVLEIETPKSR